MRNSVLWQRGKKIWRPKCAYFVWHPSGALLTRSREREGVCITDALPFGTPDQTLTGDLPLRSLAFLLVRYTHHNFPLFLIRYDIVWLLVNLHKNP